MALHVLCPECGKRYEVADEQAGGTGTCPACGTVARIPTLDAPMGGRPPQGSPPAYPPYTPATFPPQPHAAAYGDQAYFYEMAVASFEVHRFLSEVHRVGQQKCIHSASGRQRVHQLDYQQLSMTKPGKQERSVLPHSEIGCS